MRKKTQLTDQKEKITRKEAIKKAGVTALAASSLLLLNTKAEASGSGCQPGGSDGGNGGGNAGGNGGGHHGGH